jgi:hypothetical protein
MSPIAFINLKNGYGKILFYKKEIGVNKFSLSQFS